MLKIGELADEADAQTFGDYLYARGIENQVDAGPEGRWDVWIVSETDVPSAQELLEKFRLAPNSPEYRNAAADAEIRRRQEEREAAAAAPRSLRDRWKRFPVGLPGPLTVTLMVISIVVYGLQNSASAPAVEQALSIARYRVTAEAVDSTPYLSDILSGQVWRLITPIFLHFGILHILFNMFWLRDLGGMIEKKNGGKWLGVLVFATAAFSNLAQYTWSGPMFGGMSGVVYGLLGYAWMKSRFDPFSGYALKPATVTTMLVWFVICLFGLMGPIANAAHGGGLVAGIVWGYTSARLRPKN